MDIKLTSINHTVKKVLTGGIVASMLVAASAQAKNPAPTIKVDAPNKYTVKKGDTLWDLSGRYLNQPWRWKEIWATNRHIKNPHLIYPGDTLIMCIIKGKTLVGVDTGEGCVGIEKQLDKQPESVAVTPAAGSIPAIPLSNISKWLDKNVIVNPQNYNATPYVIASKTGNLLTASGDKIYVRNKAGAALETFKTGQKVGIYREGKPYINPVTKEVMGLEVTQIATARVDDYSKNGVYGVTVLSNYGKSVREGDRMFVELGNFLPPAFSPKAANVNAKGKIIRVLDSIGSAASHSIVAVNLGSNMVSHGDVFTVYKKGKLIRDTRDNDTPVRLHSEPVANLMIFNTFDNISYGYVLDSELPIGVGDLLLSPDAE